MGSFGCFGGAYCLQCFCGACLLSSLLYCTVGLRAQVWVQPCRQASCVFDVQRSTAVGFCQRISAAVSLICCLSHFLCRPCQTVPIATHLERIIVHLQARPKVSLLHRVCQPCCRLWSMLLMHQRTCCCLVDRAAASLLGASSFSSCALLFKACLCDVGRFFSY
jgi:hypothetical protein